MSAEVPPMFDADQIAVAGGGADENGADRAPSPMRTIHDLQWVPHLDRSAPQP
jgi:hypothetical protein